MKKKGNNIPRNTYLSWLMKYTTAQPCPQLASRIHAFWELKGDETDRQWERIFPDGCPGIIINLGASCKTDGGVTTMEHGRTYVVGAMTSFKDSYVDNNTHLLGVCFKPAVFSSFYKYSPQNELTDHTVEFERPYSLDMGMIHKDPVAYLNKYFLDRKGSLPPLLLAVLNDMHLAKGTLSIYETAKRNFITLRQLERMFKTHIGLTPKEYVKIIRFQSALSMMNDAGSGKSLADIAFDCGYYDQSHLTNEIKKHTGLTPAQF
ncbi:MAG: AraC family transcriptional regulator [Chitinophaga sp.]|uniref:helix-turn-helix domain-containing protein n=1 Tax=Chitinophaga sp. TaxID=1869181 RepID=UPI001B251B99|nr:helix-turn-helix domain-containing protein [Chitinophaga sp.]MBO9728345.1 AraC family transcriptional regulator [Chitinophaga sp.]